MSSTTRGWQLLLLSAAFALAAPAAAGAATQPLLSGSMLVGATSEQLTLTSSQTTADGRVQNRWSVGPGGSEGSASATAPAGSTISVTPTLMTITPPQALSTDVVASVRVRGRHGKTGGPIAKAAWTNPAPGSDFNALSGSHCFPRTCVYASSVQHAIQENPGNWYMGQKITGTVYPAGGSATLGEAYNSFPGESGDSGPINYKPSGDSCPSSGSSWGWSFSYGGFGFSESNALSGGACYGPIAPSGWNFPAFGSRWWSGGQSGNHGIGSGEAVHLGAGQNPYDQLAIGGN